MSHGATATSEFYRIVPTEISDFEIRAILHESIDQLHM